MGFLNMRIPCLPQDADEVVKLVEKLGYRLEYTEPGFPMGSFHGVSTYKDGSFKAYHGNVHKKLENTPIESLKCMLDGLGDKEHEDILDEEEASDMRILKISIKHDGGVSEYKITSEKGCCFKNLMPNRLKKELVEHLKNFISEEEDHE